MKWNWRNFSWKLIGLKKWHPFKHKVNSFWRVNKKLLQTWENLSTVLFTHLVLDVLAHCLIGKWRSNNAVSMQHYQISSDNSINIWFSDFSLSQYHIHGVHEEERRSPSPQCQSHEPHSTGNGCPQSTQTSNPRRRNRAMSMNLENFHVRIFDRKIWGSLTECDKFARFCLIWILNFKR